MALCSSSILKHVSSDFKVEKMSFRKTFYSCFLYHHIYDYMYLDSLNNLILQ